MKRITRPSAWKLALLVGFSTQLLLLVFVTAIGLQQLAVTTDSLNKVVDVHMRKLNLTKTMAVAARERTMFMLMLSKIEDPLERDRLLTQFSKNGSTFGVARQALLELPLNARERELLALQRQLTGDAQPIQIQVIDLINAGFIADAEDLILKQAVPAQNKVIDALSQLDAEAQRVALAASRKEYEDHEVARRWIYLLSGIALLVGSLVAVFVLYYTSRVGRER